MSLHDPALLSTLFDAANRRCRFRVWAPLKEQMILRLIDPERDIVMMKDDDGYFSVTVDNIESGCRYLFIPENKTAMPDPASNFQPEGVHGYSQVVDHSRFQWTDQAWKGVPMNDMIMYELHVGTFTNEGTFDAVIPRLKELRDCGINSIELMPVSQFPGNRNWGYDGVFPYAVQNSYGGPDALKQLVDACHSHGIAVILDVVYNHIGPEGNCLSHYGPYFTNKYSTPWGESINFDGEWSDGVREYFANNALYWIQYFHVDGLRLDAIHMVFDQGAIHFWQYMNERVRKISELAGRPLHMIAESDLNSPRVTNPMAIGGSNFRAQWLDDFHHALYVLLDDRGKERYEDFGMLSQLAKAYKDGFVHSGEYVKFRKRRHGVSSAGISGDHFVVFTSNHDQIGNRPDGARLSSLINFERLKLAAAALILSPYVPMLFMGEEYGEEAPFFYFISHSDKALIEAVRKGRREEFKSFRTEGEWPDPQDESTFRRATLNWNMRTQGRHAILLRWYKKLIELRKELPALKDVDKNNIQVFTEGEDLLIIYRQGSGGGNALLCFVNFSEQDVDCPLPLPGNFRKILDSTSGEWSENADLRSAPEQINRNVTPSIPPLTFCIYERNSLPDRTVDGKALLTNSSILTGSANF